MYYGLLVVLISAGLAFIPASMARNKGYSYVAFWFISFLLSFIVGIILAACLKNKQIVHTAEPDTQPEIPPGFCGRCGKVLVSGAAFCYACGTAAMQPKSKKPGDFARQKTGFFTDYFGLLPMFAVLVAAFVIGSTSEHFYTAINFKNIISQSAIYIVFAMTAAVTARAKGPDISVGAIAGLGAMIIATNIQSGNEATGILFALLVCVAAGLINGVIVVLGRMPAVIATLVTGTLFRVVTLLFAGSNPIPIDESSFAVSFADLAVGPFILIFLAGIIAFLYAWRVSVLKKKSDDGRRLLLWNIAAYGVSGILACLAGFFILGFTRAGQYTIGSGYEFYIMFAYFAVISSRLLSHPLGGVFYAILPGLFYSLYSNIMNITQMVSITQMTVFYGLILVFGIFAGVVQYRLGRTTGILRQRGSNTGFYMGM